MKRWTWLALALGIALRVALLTRSLDTLDRWFVPDDTYYTLSIARSLAHGLGPSLDGTVLSNGFQPLLAFLLVPVFWLSHDLDVPLRCALAIGALADGVVLVLMARLGQRLLDQRAAAIAVALWAVSPVAVANALNGLETSLTLATELGLIASYAAVCAAPARRRRWLGFGACAGLCLLARVDSVFLLSVLLGFELVARDRQRWPGRLLALAAACAVIAPWWVYSLVRFGTVVPESGPALIALTRLHRELYMSTPRQLGWAAGSVLGAPFADWAELREWLLYRTTASVACFAGLALLLAFAAQRWSRAERTRPLGAFALHSLLVLAFYALVVPAMWFFRRYLAACQLTLTWCIAWCVARAWLVTSARLGRAAVLVRIAPSVALAGLAVLALGSSLDFLLVTPIGSRRGGLHGTEGYRDPARDVLARLPGPTVLGALQSGALAYYAPPSVRVVNLDGVVDGNARRAGQAHRLAEYARARGVNYLIDWPFNIECFLRLSTEAKPLPIATRVEARIKMQNDDQFLILALRWP